MTEYVGQGIAMIYKCFPKVSHWEPLNVIVTFGKSMSAIDYQCV